VNSKGVLFIHDAKSHVAKRTREILQQLGWERLCLAPYSPDLSTTYYHLFHSLDNHLRGRFFANKGDLRNALTDLFSLKTVDFYHQGIVQLQERWQKVLDADGAYFET